MNAVMEFIVRMKDEASAGLASTRENIKKAAGSGKELEKVSIDLSKIKRATSEANPALGEFGSKMNDVSSSMSRAREAISKTVGIVGMVTGTFMAAYTAVKPLGEYIRRMWDPVARAAYDWEKLEKKIKDVDEWVRKQGEDEKNRALEISSGYAKEEAWLMRLTSARRSLAAASEKSGSVAEAKADINDAEGMQGIAAARVVDLEKQLQGLQTQRKGVQQKFDLAANTRYEEKYANEARGLDARIKAVETERDDAMIAYQEAQANTKTAIAALDTARANDIKERMEKLKDHYRKDLDLRLENVRKEADALSDAKSKAQDRLSRAQDASKQAWSWYRDPAAFRAQLDEERAQAEAEKRFERDAAALRQRQERAQASMWGDRGLQLSESEQAVQRVLSARAEEAAAKAALVKIEENTRGLGEMMRKLLALRS